MRIILRSEAKQLGLDRYFTGKPCVHGHVSERYTKWGLCISCLEVGRIKYRQPPEKRREQQRNSRLKNIEKRRRHYFENKEQKNAYRKDYYIKNSKKELEKNKIWRAANKERLKVLNNRLREKDPEKHRAYVRNRRARRKRVGGSHTDKDILEILRMQNWKCAWCTKSLKKKRHIDHIVPIYLGGSNDRTNLQGLCQKCNCSKGHKDPLIWARENGNLL